MQLRKIVLQPDVKFVDLSTGRTIQRADQMGNVLGDAEPLTHFGFISRLMRDPKFGKDPDGSADSQAVYWAYDIWAQKKTGLEPGDGLLIEEACWTRLVSCLDKPSAPYDAAIMCQCISFFKAIKDAEKVEVAEKQADAK